MSIIIAETIKALRAQKGISQEILAEHMSVSVQAVSKWENGLSCPDIGSLPDLAAYFGVSIDYLLTGKESASELCGGLPDDGKLRIVQAIGSRILDAGSYDKDIVIKLKMPDRSVQPQLNVEIVSSCAIEGDVNGNVDAGAGINCGNVGGYADAGAGICCGHVGKYVDAGAGVNCGNVGQYIDAGGGVNCGNVGQYVDAGGSVNCGNVQQDVSSGGKVECADIGGSVTCGGDISCHTIHGNVNCDGDIHYSK